MQQALVRADSAGFWRAGSTFTYLGTMFSSADAVTAVAAAPERVRMAQTAVYPGQCAELGL